MRLGGAAVWRLAPLLALGHVATAAGQGEVEVVLRRIGAYVEQYYSRAQSFVGIETVRLLTLRPDLIADGFGRRLDYELKLEWTPRLGGEPATATMTRRLLTVNGRRPKPKDEPQCLDPHGEQTEPMSMLLPESQGDYTFSSAGTSRMDGRRVAMLDYRETTKPSESITWKDDDCISAQIDGRSVGRVWADPATGEVLRLDMHLKGMVDFRVPREHQRAWGSFVTLDRSDFSVRYKAVTFRDPDETLLLPASIDTLSVWKGEGRARHRKTQQFSNYQRFETGGRLVDSDGIVPDGAEKPSETVTR